MNFIYIRENKFSLFSLKAKEKQVQSPLRSHWLEDYMAGRAN